MYKMNSGRIAHDLINVLSDDPMESNSIRRDGVRTRFRRLLDDLGELNDNNGVALWVRYFWESQIEKILAGKSFHPSALEIDLTTYCDSGCFFCKEGLEKRRLEYPFQRLEEDLRAFAAFPETGMVIFSGGGEPTCYSRFADAMRLAYGLGYNIYVSTHGGNIGSMRLSHEVFTNFCTILKFSIGAATHATYNKVHNRRIPLPEQSSRTVDYVLAQCQKISDTRRVVRVMNVPVKLPRLLIAMTVNPLNQHEVLLMTKKAIDAGADTAMFRPVITTQQSLRHIDEGVRQMQEARERYGKQIEILTFNHRMDYGAKQEDYFNRRVCHPVVSPQDADGKVGSVTPCLFRRGNRPEHAWLSGGETNVVPLTSIIRSETYQQRIQEQDECLQSRGTKRCPRCRKVPNNIFLDILFQASPRERDLLRTIILLLFPRNPVGELIKGLH